MASTRVAGSPTRRLLANSLFALLLAAGAASVVAVQAPNALPGAPDPVNATVCGAGNPEVTGFLTSNVTPNGTAPTAKISSNYPWVFGWFSRVNVRWGCTSRYRYDGLAWNTGGAETDAWGLLTSSLTNGCLDVVGTDDFIHANNSTSCPAQEASILSINLTPDGVYYRNGGSVSSVGNYDFIHTSCAANYGAAPYFVGIAPGSGSGNPGSGCTVNDGQAYYDDPGVAQAFWIDTVGPTVGAPNPTATLYTTATSGTVTWPAAYEASSGIYGYYVNYHWATLSNGTCINVGGDSSWQWVGNTTSWGPGWGSNLCFQYQVLAQDNVGNYSAASAWSAWIESDQIAPDPTTTLSVGAAVYNTSGAITSNWTTSDAGTGVNGTAHYVRSRPVVANACTGTIGGWELLSSAASGSMGQNGLADGTCYQWATNVNDRAGNTYYETDGLAGISQWVMIDTVAPTHNGHTFSGGSNWFASGSALAPTVYVRTAAAGSLTASASVSDALSGISYVYFNCGTATSGWTCASGVDASSPYQLAISWNAGAGAWDHGVASQAVDNAGSGSAATPGWTFVADNTAPVPTWTSPTVATAVNTTNAFNVTWSEADAGAGVASRSGQWQSALYSANACGTFANTGSSFTPSAGSASTSSGGITLTNGNCYRLVLTLTDNVGNANTSTGFATEIDASAPAAPTVTDNAPAGSFRAGNTVFFRPAAAGTIALTSTGSDADSGIASSTFGALSSSTGWTYTSGTVSGNPANKNLTWSGSAVSATLPVTTTNNADSTSSATTITFTADVSAPTPTWSIPAAGLTRQAVASLNVTWSESDGAGAGMSSRSLQRQSAVVTIAGTCDGIVFANEGSPSAATSPVAVSGLSSGTCYRWLLTLTDAVGNSAVSTSDAVLVDSSAPVALSVSSSGSHTYASSPTVWFDGSLAGSLTLSAEATDAQSGLTSMTFGVLSNGSGWSPGQSLPYVASSSPYQLTLAWSAGAASTTQTITATNGTGATTQLIITFVDDSSAPTASFSIPIAGTSAASATALDVTWTETDGTGSGVASRSIQRQQAVLAAPGVCDSAWTDEGSPSSAASPLSQTSLTGGFCYRWVIDLTDYLGHAGATTSGALLVDPSAPAAPAVVASGDSFKVGSTVFFAAGTSGSLTLTSTGSDAQSAIASSTFGALSVTSGWTYTSATVTGNPSARTLSFGSSALTSDLDITVRNGAGSDSAATSLSLVPDGTAPNAAFSYPAPGLTYSTDAAPDVTWDESDGAGSGIASRSLQRVRAAVESPGVCPASGYTADGAASSAISPHAVSGLLSGNCYRWLQTLTDQVGNSAVSSSGTLLVDLSAPPDPSVTVTGSSAVFVAGDTIYFNTSGTYTFTLTGDSVDPQSGLDAFNFGALSVDTGWTSAPTLPFADSTAPYAVDLTHAPTALNSSLDLVATNAAGSTSSPTTVVLTADADAPDLAFNAPAPATQDVSSDGTYAVTWTESDATSGLNTSSRSLQRQSAAPAAGVCPASGWVDAGSPTVSASPLSVSGLASGTCYRWQLSAADHVGHTTSTTSGSLLVDTTAPDAPAASASGAGVYQVDTTVWFGADAAGSLTLTVVPTPDLESGIAYVTFAELTGAPSGWTPDPALPSQDASDPYSQDLGWAIGAQDTTLSTTATNGVGLVSNPLVLSLTADELAPTVTFTVPGAGTSLQTATTIEATWSEDDAGAGVDATTRSLQRQQAAIAVAGSCPISGWSDDGSATVSASPRSDVSLLTGFCYRYQVTLADLVGNSATSTSGAILIDTTAPAAPSASVSTTGTYRVGEVIWFDAAGTGSLAVTATPSDPQSGIDAVTFSALSNTADWTPSPTLPNSDGSSPYTQGLAWTAGSLETALALNTTNGVGLSSGDTTLTFTPDASDPTVSFSTPATGTHLHVSATVTVDFTVADTGSGVGSTTLTRWRTAVTTPGSCPTSGYTLDATLTSPQAPVSESGLSSGFCYEWRLAVADNLGHTAGATSGRVLIDVSAPDEPTVSSSSGSNLYRSGDTIFFDAAGGGSLTLTATGVDPESGVTTAAFGALSGTASGWSPSDATSISGVPAERTYTWSASAVSTSLAVTVVNGVGLASAPHTLTLTADATAPAATFTSPSPDGLEQVETSLEVAWSQVEIGSGLASSSLQQQAAPEVDGSCVGVSWADQGDAVASPVSPLNVTDFTGGYCYRWELTLTDQVGHTSTTLSGILRITTSAGLSGVPSSIFFPQGFPGAISNATSFNLNLFAQNAFGYELSVTTSDLLGPDGTVVAQSVTWSVDGTSYPVQDTSPQTVISHSGASEAYPGDTYTFNPSLLIPFVASGAYAGTVTFTMSGL